MTDALYVSAASVASATKKKATIIRKSGLGNIIVEHVYLLDHGTQKYAQYPSAVFIKYVLKGKRNPTGFVQTYSPYLVILDGWQSIESQSMWGNSYNHANGTKITEGKYTSFDERWASDFEAANKFENVIADYRDFNTMKVAA